MYDFRDLWLIFEAKQRYNREIHQSAPDLSRLRLLAITYRQFALIYAQTVFGDFVKICSYKPHHHSSYPA